METILTALISGLIFIGWIPACYISDKLKERRKKLPDGGNRTESKHNISYFNCNRKGA